MFYFITGLYYVLGVPNNTLLLLLLLLVMFNECLIFELTGGQTFKYHTHERTHAHIKVSLPPRNYRMSAPETHQNLRQSEKTWPKPTKLIMENYRPLAVRRRYRVSFQSKLQWAAEAAGSSPPAIGVVWVLRRNAYVLKWRLGGTYLHHRVGWVLFFFSNYR